eukprot:768745-Hanusia_phi.AAC.1
MGRVTHTLCEAILLFNGIASAIVISSIYPPRGPENGGTTVTLESLSICDPASITSFLPSVGPLAGSTEITLKGTNFFNSPGISCDFFAIGAVPAWWISSSLVVCLSPPSTEPVVRIEFSNNGVDYTEDGLSFHYSLSALPLSLIPSIGLSEGNFIISVVGRNFLNFSTFRCRIDGTYVIASVVNASFVLAKLPPKTRQASLTWVNASSGPDCVQLDCSNNDVDFLPQDGLSFCYFDAVQITNLQPSAGPAVGGTELSVFGVFYTVGNSKYRCSFNLTHLVQATMLSSSSISCLSPGLLEGLYHVDLLLDQLLISKVGVASYYQAYGEILIFFFSPQSGPELGGSIVSVTGLNFQGGRSLVCRFGDAGSNSTTFVSTSPVITGLLPTAGYSINKIHKMTVVGRNFLQGQSIGCVLDRENLSVQGRFISSLFIECAFQIVREEQTLLYFSLDIDGFRIPNDISFLLAPKPRIYDVFPTMGGSEGGQIVPAKWYSSTTISCDMQPSRVQDTNMAVSNNGQDFVICSQETAQDSPQSASISIFPTRGPVFGGVYVYVYGLSLSTSMDLECAFCSRLSQSTGGIACVSPSMDREVDCDIQIFVNGIKQQHPTLKFRYQNSSAFLQLDPSAGPNTGGTVIHVRSAEFQSIPFMCSFGKLKVESFMAYFETSSLVKCSIWLFDSQVLEIILLDSATGQMAFCGHISIFPNFFSIQPSIGPLLGSSLITLESTLKPFMQDLSCYWEFNSTVNYQTPAILHVLDAELYSSERITCRTPFSGTTATIGLKIYFQYPKILLHVFAYEFEPLASIYTVQPLSLRMGNQIVTVLGMHFRSNPQLVCNINRHTSRSFWLSSTKILCTVHVANGQRYALSVSNNQADFSNEVTLFTSKALAIATVYPSYGPLLGGTWITISGGGWERDDAITCEFGSLVSNAELQAPTHASILCRVPKFLSNDPSPVDKIVELKVIAQGAEGIRVGYANFLYRAPGRIIAIEPTMGSYQGGEALTVVGEYFPMVSTVNCNFTTTEEGNTTGVRARSSRGEWHSSSIVYCISPAVQ